MRAIIKDRQYGCFDVFCKCKNCDKVLLKKSFDWGRDKIGMGQKDKIEEMLIKQMDKSELSYCYRCGNRLAHSIEF